MSSSPATSRPRSPALPHIGVGAALSMIVLLGLALRLTGIDAASYWTDEVFSVVWSRETLSFLWGPGLAIETNPPLYYTLLHVWMRFAGEHAAGVRLLGALASTAAIPAVFLLMREFVASPTALLAAGLLAVTPVQVAYAQEARVYALLPVLATLATLGLARFVRRGSVGSLALYAVAAVLLMYSHATSVFTLAALNLCALVAMLPTRRQRLAPWLLANLAVAILAAPALRALLIQAGSPNIAWITRPGAHLMIEELGVLLVDPSTSQVHFRSLAVLAAVLLAALAIALRRHPPSREALLFLAAPGALFLLLLTVVSFRVPVLIPRVTVWLSVPLVALMALAARDRVNRLLVGVPLLLCLAIGLHGVWSVTPRVKEDFRGLMADLTPRIAAGDRVAVGPDTTLIAVAFYGGPRDLLRWQPDPAPINAVQFAARRTLTVQDIDSADLATRARAGHFWLILDLNDQDQHSVDVARLLPPPRVALRDHPRLVALGW